MFTPKMDKLLLPTVWLDAANQVRLKIFLHSSHADWCWQTFERGHSDAKQIKFCLSGFQLRSLSGLLLLWPCLWLDHKLWQLQQPRQELRQGRDHHHRLQCLHGHLRLRGHLLHPWLQGGSPLWEVHGPVSNFMQEDGKKRREILSFFLSDITILKEQMTYPEFKDRLLEDIPYEEYRGAMDGFLR